jgi:mono/diheme cytochrome c family protein
MKTLWVLVIYTAVLAAIDFGWIVAGGIDFAADSPHSPLVYRLIGFARERSIDVRARNIAVPPLNDPNMIAEGAEHYGAMCDGCHLAPGKSSDEFRDGLYPQPPDLVRTPIDSPAEAFWVIKHGIKGSAMPAWGRSHDEATIWAIVAFLHKLPQLTPEQYKQMTANGEHDDAATDHNAAAPTQEPPAH